MTTAKSAKSKSGQQEDAKSNITDDNNTSAAETTIPLDDETRKSNGELSTKSGKIKFPDHIFFYTLTQYFPFHVKHSS